MNTTSKKNNICAVIPFYNEKETLAEVIRLTLSHVDKIILVDDGSDDGSMFVVPQDEKIILISHDKNRGKGASIKTGLNESLLRGFEISFTLDADLQHPPGEIPKFLEELRDKHLVVGNRLDNTASMPWQRKLSNRLTSFLLSLKTKTILPDTQCGYRCFRNNILGHILPEFTGFEAESEMLIKAAKNNLKIGFVNIPTLYGNEKSRIKPIKTIIGFLRVLFI